MDSDAMKRMVVVVGMVLFPLLVQGESLYVIDTLRVGVRAEAVSTGPSVEVVKSGDVLTLLAEEGRYYKVRTADGEEGWINKGYVSTEKPAMLRIGPLEEENKKLRGEIEALKAADSEGANTLLEMKQQVETQQQALAEAAAKEEVLQQRIDELSGKDKPVWLRYRWAFELAAVALVLLLGLYGGNCSYRCKVRKRFGGLEI